jgi:dipeptidyl-peptidase-3
MTSKLKKYEFQGRHFQVTRGDYAPILQKAVEHLEKAKVGLASGVHSGSLGAAKRARKWEGGPRLT